MAGTFRLSWDFQDTDPFAANYPATKTISVSYTRKHEYIGSLAVTDATTVWDPYNVTNPVTVFAALLAYCKDGVADLELGTSVTSATAGQPRWTTHRLTTSAPFFLAADDAYDNHSTSGAFGAATNAAVVNKIRVQNPTTGTTVNVRILLLGA